MGVELSKTDASAAGGGDTSKDPAVAFLLPTYKTPFLTADLLMAASACGKFNGCTFVLLLDVGDPQLLAYKNLVANMREKGLSVGFFVFDGTPYCGKINRVAPIVNADCVCVIDSSHLPFVNGESSVAEVVRTWLTSTSEPMRIGTFVAEGFYPVVTRKLIDRLGYMFHPLCGGRIAAENWLLTIASELGIVSMVPDCKVIESSADAVEIEGVDDPDDIRWTGETLCQTLEDEAERLGQYLLR